MSEKPKPNSFPMSDGQYCHISPEQIIIVRGKELKKIPAAKHGPNMLSVVLLMIGGILSVFFLANFILTQYYPMAFLMIVSAIAIIFGLKNQMKYSDTQVIERSSIIKTVFRKKAVGFDFFEVYYKGDNGKVFIRRIGIYDSAEINQQARELMHSEGLI